MRRNGVTFRLFCVNINVDNEHREGFDLAVPRFGK